MLLSAPPSRPPRSRGGGPPIPAPAPPGPRRDLPRPRLKLRPSGRPTDATRARIRHCRPRLIPNGVLLAYGASKLLSAMVSDAQLFLPLVLPLSAFASLAVTAFPAVKACRNLRARDAGQRPLPGDGVAALRAHARAPVSRRPSGAAGRRSNVAHNVGGAGSGAVAAAALALVGDCRVLAPRDCRPRHRRRRPRPPSGHSGVAGPPADRGVPRAERSSGRTCCPTRR